MIQRIQSVYLFVSIVVLFVASFTSSFFYYITDVAIVNYAGLGITKTTHDHLHVIENQFLPICIVTIALAVLGIVVLFSFKNLKKQLRLAQLFWGLYLMIIIGFVCWYYLVDESSLGGKVIQSNYGISFFLLIIGLGCAQLAFLGIKKDKKKIESLDRLR
ncbi:MAG TPA: DUF4293 family protein [Taishania sp.]|nr:DUF4293 family protein [Taishania sp.]